MSTSNPYPESGLNFHIINQRLSELNMKKKDLCSRLGIYPEFLSAMKAGRKSPGLILVLKISKLLEVHPLDICQVDYFTDLLSGYPYNS